MDRWKAEQGRGREKRKIRREDQKRKSQKKEDADARKGRKVAKHCVFPMICGSGGSKSRLAKAAGAEPAGQMRDENLHAVVARSTFWSQNVQNTSVSDDFWKLRCRKKCTPLWREAHFEVKMYKTNQFRTTFGSWDVEKSGRRCGAKHILKSKCTKHTSFGPLLEVEMSKKCTPLWREAHFEVKMCKTPQCRTTFGSWDVEKVHAVVARSTCPSQNVQNTPASDDFWKLRCRKSARRCGAKHMSKSKCTKHHMFASLLEVRMSLRFTTLHYTTLHYTTLHYTTLHYTTLHYTTLQLQLHNYTPLHSTTLNYTTLHYITLHYTPLHYITLHCTTFHYTSLHYTTLHYTTTTTTTKQLHSTTIHSTTLHYTQLHYTTLHYTTLHSTTLHYTTLPYTTLHYITLHYTPLQLQLHNYTPQHEITLHYTTLHYTTFHYTPLHNITQHYTTKHRMTLHHR